MPFGSLYQVPTLVDESLTQDEEIVFGDRRTEAIGCAPTMRLWNTRGWDNSPDGRPAGGSREHMLCHPPARGYPCGPAAIPGRKLSGWTADLRPENRLCLARSASAP